MPMRGLTVIVATDDRARFQAAVTIASAQAALGGRARLYFNEGAVRLLADMTPLATAGELGVSFIACQTGLADAGLALPDGVQAGGMVSLLAELEDDRLIAL
jgi:predicted peroxiredoxin